MIVSDIKNFQGNTKLKQVNQPIAMTQHEVSEFKKCAADYIYFIETYMKFLTLDKGLTTVSLFPFQKDVLNTYAKERFVIFKCPRQAGKALAIDTPIPTPDGFRPMGDLKPGDLVFGSDGKPTKVTFVTDTMHDHQCYKITFDSGHEIIADAEHLWEVHIDDNKRTTFNTKELFERLPKVKRRCQSISIKNQKAVDFGSAQQLPIDPYILGLWLGDGDSSTGKFTCSDNDWPLYEQHIKKAGYELTPMGFKMDGRSTSPHTGYFAIRGLGAKLRALGLIKNKHIPDIYKKSSIADRQELIRGLMDSDGACDIDKKTLNVSCYFSQRLGRLMEDVKEVFASLGVKTRYKTDNSNQYGILRCSTVLFDLFKIPRKLERQLTLQGAYQLQNHYIKSIEPTKSVPVRCIQVAAADHLYLCGKGFIPTHNTSITVGYILWYVLFNSDKTVGILAQKEKTAKEILNRIKMAYENLPLWIQQGISEWNKQNIVLENGSKILAEATASGSIRGFTLNLVYIDEFAHIPSNIAEDFFTSVYPTITSGTTAKMLITSTPKGLNLFYKFWTDAKKKFDDAENWNGFTAIECHWSDVPGRDAKWAKEQRRILGDTKYAQEVECEFIGSTNTLISGKKLRELAFIRPVKKLFDEKYCMYEDAKPDRVYVLTADPAGGTGLDYSTFTIFDVTETPYKVVGKYRDNKVDTVLFPSYIQMAAIHYNNAYVIVENNDMGALVCDTLLNDLEYDNMFFSLANDNAEITASQSGRARIPGLKTTKKTKMQGCNRLKTIIESDQILINDFDIVSELGTFVLQSNRVSYGAEINYHDDCVSNLWLFAWLTAQPIFKDVSDFNIRNKVYADRLRAMEEDMPCRPIIRDQKNNKVPETMFVSGGALFINADVDYQAAMRELHGFDSDAEPTYDEAFKRLYP